MSKMELKDVQESADFHSLPPSPTLFSLPAEIVQHIVSFLSLEEVCKLGATCRHAHALTHDESFWGLQVRRQFRLFFTAEKDTVREAWEDEDLRRPPLEGIVCDPGIQGNREVSVLYSAEFRRIMMERNKSKPDPFRVMLENSIKDMLPRLLAFYVQLPQEEQCSARLVLFGPGIESPSTRHLVHKMVNARSSTFDAVEFIKGLPGGIGSGVRINYKHMYNFDLMCLYTNSEIIRERLYLGNRAGRLDPDLNRMIVKSGCSLQLQPSILKLLPTLHCLLFAVDTAMGEGEKLEEVMDVIRSELEVVIQGFRQFQLFLPLVVLACRGEGQAASHLSLRQIVEGLKLGERTSPWGVFEVDVENMRGVERGLDWVLHHLAKKRRDWSYHTSQGKA